MPDGARPYTPVPGPERLSGRGSCCAEGLGNGLAEECLVPPCARLRAKTRGSPTSYIFPQSSKCHHSRPQARLSFIVAMSWPESAQKALGPEDAPGRSRPRWRGAECIAQARLAEPCRWPLSLSVNQVSSKAVSSAASVFGSNDPLPSPCISPSVE